MESTVIGTIILSLIGLFAFSQLTKGGIKQLIYSPLRLFICFMVIWIALPQSEGLCCPNQNSSIYTIDVSRTLEPCICSPPMKRSINMQKIEKSGNDPAMNQNGYGMELKTLDINSVIIPDHYFREDFGDIESLIKSLRREGPQEPLLVYEIDEGKYCIIDGARRKKAFEEMGRTEVPCLVRQGISDAEAAHLSFIKNAERKTITVIETAKHIKRMRDKFGFTLEELSVKGYGASIASIKNKLTLLDLPEPIQKQIGAGILAEGHGLALSKLEKPKEQMAMAKRIIDHGYSVSITQNKVRRLREKQAKPRNDATSKIIPSTDIPNVYFKDSSDMSELPNSSVHLIVTSPPYWVGMEFEKGISYTEHWENMKAVMKECARVTVDGGIIALNVGDIHNFRGSNGKNKFTQIQLVGHKYQNFLRSSHVYLTDIITWVKSTHPYSQDMSKAWSDKIPHTGYRILLNSDPIYIFRKKGEREVPPEDVVLKSQITKQEWAEWAPGIWNIGRVHKMEGHPAIYPDELVRRLIKMYSYEGDTVLDSFLGSGTTIKVARELNREGIGYEREIQYKPVIMKKLGIAVPANAQPDTTVEADPTEEKINALREIFEQKVTSIREGKTESEKPEPEPEFFSSFDVDEILK